MHFEIRSMKHFLVLSVSLLASNLPAVPGAVQTLDGKTFEGDLHLERGQGVVLTNSEGAVLRIPLSRLLGGKFNQLSVSNMAGATDISRLPAPWQEIDVGPVGLRGRASCIDESFVVAGSGARIWSARPDEFHFVYRPFVGEGQFVAQLLQLEGQIAGIMFRKDLSADSEFMLEGISVGGEGLVYRSRRGPEHRKAVKKEGDWMNRPEVRVPCWLRLVRGGKWVNAYKSWDAGVSWEHVYGSPDHFPAEIYAGFFVMGGTSNTLREATFRNVLLEDEGSASDSATNSPFASLIVLRNGSVLAGRINAFDSSSLKVSAFDKEYRLSLVNVARILFQPLLPKFARQISPGRNGVLLSNGDFFEGEFRSLEKGQLKISSVLFGNRTFTLSGKVIALVLRDPAPAPLLYAVRTLNGSVLNTISMTAEQEAVGVVDPTVGPLRIPLDQLAEIKQQSSTR